MSCPYFYPTAPRTPEADARAALLPLGNWWAGACRAVSDEPCTPDEIDLLPLCHLGYARGHCRRFPAGSVGPDAVRFVMQRDDGRSLHLSYVLERDHHPWAHGALEYVRAAERFTEPPADPIVNRQAEAYVAAYLFRKAER